MLPPENATFAGRSASARRAPPHRDDACSVSPRTERRRVTAITTLASREFNQDPCLEKRAAAEGPVFVTDRGRPSLVLITFDDWMKLSGRSVSIAEALSGTIAAAAEPGFQPAPDPTQQTGRAPRPERLARLKGTTGGHRRRVDDTSGTPPSIETPPTE